MPERRLWGIHNDEPSIDFVRDGFVALGWDEIGDIRRFGGDRGALKDAIAAQFPMAKAGAIPVWAGVLTRFAGEMQPGDLIVHPRRSDRTVNLGVVEGDYKFHPEVAVHRNRRRVRWLRTELTRTTFTQGALYEIGSAVTLFRVRTHDDEFFAIVDGSQPKIKIPIDGEDETAGVEDEPDAERITETTRDYVIRTLATDLIGHPFAHFVAHLLEAMGYRTQVSPEGPDRGVDIVAHKDPLGLEPPIIKVQCKSTQGQIGSPDVSGLLGTLGQSELGLFVTLGRFSTDARNLARDRPNLRLIDGQDLVNLVLEHYDEFSPEYKAKLPMRRVFVPDQTTST